MKNVLLFLATVFVSLIIFSPIHSQEITPETFFLDDMNIQEYNGQLGKWVFVQNKSSLGSFIREFSSTENGVALLNPGSSNISNQYLFIPFGQEYIDSLNQKNIERQAVIANIDQFIWPVGNVVRITSVLGFRGREFHTGLDIPAEKGTPIRAALEGQIIFEGYSGGYGNVIDIQHRNGFITRYGHASVNLVHKGDFVKKGQIISFVGSTGRSTGNHLHFEILCNTIPLDPLDFLPDSSKVQIVHRLKNWKHQ